VSSHKLRPINWPSGIKALVFDIEAMSFKFNPGMGEILCVAFQSPKWKEPRAVSYDDFEGYRDYHIQDRDFLLCQWMAEHFQDVETFIAHYGHGFDRPFITARMMYHGLGPFVQSIDEDTHRLAKRNFNPGKRGWGEGLPCSLRNLCEFLGVEHQKTGMSKLEWRQLMTNDYPDVMRDCAEYCKQDVRATLDVFNILKTLPGTRINWSLAESGKIGIVCPNCGSDNVQRRGTRTTTVSEYRRYKCMQPKCGKWSRGTKNVWAINPKDDDILVGV